MHKETQRSIFVLNIKKKPKSVKCKQILKLHNFENNIFNLGNFFCVVSPSVDA